MKNFNPADRIQDLQYFGEFGGVNLYIPFIKNSKVRDRFILSVINMVDAGKELSGSLVIEALKEAAPERIPLLFTTL